MKKAFSKPIIILLIALLAFGTMGFSNGNGNNGKGNGNGNSPAPTSNQMTIGTIQGEFDHQSEEPATVIVELEERSVLDSKHQGAQQSRSQLETVRQQIMDKVTDAAPSSEFSREYDYVFSGFAVEVNQNEIRSIASVDGVKAIYPNVEHEAETLESLEVSADEVSSEMMDSTPFVGANQVWEDLGVTGDGVTVAIIDTGVDHTHPDLTHAFGSYKGWDFVDNDDDPQETPANDPRGESTNHGTHVAGTVAANGEIKGVAPDASLLAYRVLGPGGSGTTENVIAAIERAVEDGADVMNLSLGNTSNDPDFATSLALDVAMAEGVITVTSNGNAGPNDWTVGSPGTSRDAISVGATQLPYTIFDTSISTPSGFDYSSVGVMGHPGDEALLALNEGEFEFEFAGLGTVEEVEAADLEGKIALMQRGDLPFVEKAENAEAAGAVGAIIFNNVAGEQPDVPGMAIPTLKVSQEDGALLVDELQNGNTTVTFDISEAGITPESIADFSSRGPVTETWMIKPDLSAPGVNILSTVPTHNSEDPHGYAAFQGTSMASPHVAGAAALIVEAQPDWDQQQVKAALMNSAETLYDNEGNRYPHNTQGAGSLRVFDAITTETLVAPGSYSFGTFEKTKGKQVERQHFEINNLSNERKQFDMDVELFDGSDAIKVNRSNNLKVNPGKTQQVNMNVQVDAGKLEPGYYEGLITLTSKDEIIEVPTILFAKDPYEHFPELNQLFDSGSFVLEDGVFDIFVNLNVSVDYIDTMIYTADLAPVALLDIQENLPAGENNYQVDANWALDQLPPSNYAIVVWVGKDGKEEGWVLGEFSHE